MNTDNKYYNKGNNAWRLHERKNGGSWTEMAI